MTNRDCAAMTREELASALQEACLGNDQCRLAAGLAKGRDKRRYQQWADVHARNIRVLADALHGPPSAEILAMSDDDLMRELMA